MVLINPRNVQNKSGVVFNSGSLTKIYAEDYQVFKDSLRSAGSEVYLWVYNVTTTERNNLIPTGSGNIVFNTTVGSIQFWNGNSWVDSSSGGLTDHGLLTGLTDDDHTQYLLVNGLRTGSNLVIAGSITGGSFYGYGGTLSGVLPQGVLPSGSIPTLVSLYIPQGVIPYGSINAAIQQGIIPLGSLTLVLPQGVLPIGSIPSLSSLYIPHGQIPTGSLPNTINVSGSLIANYGSFLTNVYAGSFFGDASQLTNVPVSSHNHDGSAITTGTINDSRLPTTMSGKLFNSDISGTNGSFIGSWVAKDLVLSGSINTNNNITTAGSFIGYGGVLTGISVSSGVGSSALGVSGSIATWSNSGSIQPTKASIDSNGNGSFSGSISAGSLFSHGNIIATGSIFGYGGTITGLAGGLSGTGISGSIAVWTSSSNISYQNAKIDSNSNALFNGSVTASNGSFTGSVITAYGVIPNLLPQGAIPYGSLSASLPQGVLPIGSIPQSSIDHGTISGLTDDDHTQYLLVNGTRIGSNIRIVGSLVGSLVDISGSALGSYLQINSNGNIDGGSAVILRFNTDRPWSFRTTGSGPSTQLVLRDEGSNKSFIIQNTLGSNSFVFAPTTSNGTSPSLLITTWGSTPSSLQIDSSRTTGSALIITGSNTTNSKLTMDYLGSINIGNVLPTHTLNVLGNGSFTGSIISSFAVAPNLLPQGVLAVGSIPSLTAYIPQGVIPLGSLINSLPQGVLPVGSIPNLTAYIPQGQLINGSMPNTINISGSVVASYGSFSKNVGSFYGDGANITNITASSIDHGGLIGLADDDHTQYLLVSGTRNGSNLQVIGSVVGSWFIGSYLQINGSENTPLIKFNTDRPWQFYQTGSGAAAELTLKDLNGNKSFIIQNVLNGSIVRFFSSNSANTPVLTITPESSVHQNALLITLNGSGRGLEIDNNSTGSSLVILGSAATSAKLTIDYNGSVILGNVLGTNLLNVGGNGSFTGSVMSAYTIAPNLLPQGVLPTGSIPSLTSLYIPQGQLITGSLPNTITISQDVNARHGSFTGSITAGSVVSSGNIIASGSFYGYGGTLSGITATAGGLDTQVQFNDGGTTLSGDSGFVYNKTSDALTVNGSIITNTLNVVYGSITGSIISSVVKVDDGAVTTPSIRASDADSGIYFTSSGQELNFAINGVFQSKFNTNGLAIKSGTAAVPAVHFNSDADNGIFLGGTNTIGFSTAGSGRLLIDGNGSLIGSSVQLNGSLLGVYGSLTGNLVALNLSGTNTGDQTNISGSAVLSLPQGVLPTGSIPSLTSLYIPQGQLVTGSMPNTITISQDLNARHGSFTGSITGSSFIAALGVESLPTYSFVNDPNTGIFSSGADQVDIATGGTSRLQVTSFYVRSPVSGGFALDNNDASTSTLPIYGFRGDELTGIGRATGSTLSLIVGGSEALRIDPNKNGSLVGSLVSSSLKTNGSLLANYGSFDTNIYAGSYFGYGGNLSGISSSGGGVGSSAVGVSGSIATWSNAGSIQPIKATIDSNGNGSFIGSLISTRINALLNAGSIDEGTINDSRLPTTMTGKTFSSSIQSSTGGAPINGSFTGSWVAGSFFSHGNIIASGSVYGYGGTLSGISSSGITWSVVSGSTTLANNNGYITGSTARVIFTLPTSTSIGDVYKITGSESGGWALKQNANQFINFGNTTTTVGTTGSLHSNNRYNSIEIVCTRAGSEWNILNSVGTIGVK